MKTDLYREEEDDSDETTDNKIIINGEEIEGEVIYLDDYEFKNGTNNKKQGYENFSNVDHNITTSFTAKTYINGKEVENSSDEIDEIMEDVKEALNAFNITQNEQKEELVVCGYCGTENAINKRKCSSCGASLKTKK